MSSLPDRTRRYGLALLAIALSALLRWALPDVLNRAPYLGFYPGVVVAAMLGGTGPGLVATFGSLLLVQFVFVQFDLFDYGLQMRNVIWIVGGTGVSLVAGWLRAARTQAEHAAAMLRQSEAEIRRQKDLLGVTLASIGDAVIVTDVQGRVTFLNGEAERLTGWTSAAAAGQPLATVFRIVNEDTRQTVESPVDKVLRLGSVVGLANHTVLIARSGCEIPIDDSGAPIRQADGTMAGVVLVFRDFSERKAAEEALREGENQFRILTENLQSAVALIDEHGAFLIVNSSFLRLFDIPQDASILNVNSRDWSQWQVFDERGVLLDVDEHPVRKATLMRTAVRNQLVAVKSPSSTNLKWMLVSAEPILDAQDGVHRLICTYYDITDHKRAEEALRQSKDRLEMTLSASGAGTWDWNVVSGQIEWSSELFALFGLDRQNGDASFEDWKAIIHPDDRELASSRIDEALRQRIPLVSEYRISRPDGQIRWISALGHGEYDSQGQPVRMMGICLDITERKQAEAALAAAHRQVQSIIDNTTSIVYALDLEERFLLANTAVAEILSSTPEQMVGKRRHEFMPKEDADWHEANDRKVIEAGRALELEEHSQLKGRSITWLTTKFPLRDAQGRIYAVAGISADVSERKRAEEALRESEQRLGLTLEAGSMGKFEVDLVTGEGRWNRTEFELLGLKPGDTTPSPDTFFRFVHPDDVGILQAQWREAIRTGTLDAEFRIVRKDGQERWLAGRGRFLNTGGQATRFLGVNFDITERKRAEQQLRELNETLEKRVAERTAVAEVRAEQLRMLAQELTQAEQRERQRIAHILHEHFQQLLVGAKFSLSMVQPKDASSQESLQRTDQVLAEAVEASRSLAVELSPPILRYGGLAPALGWLGQWMHEKNGLEVEVVAEAHVATPAEDVQVLLFQAVRELLLNVVKHAKVDRARVELKQEADQLLRLTVSDQGVGFHTDPFAAKACTPGGFGLFSIRERLSFLEGRVDIQSAPGAGTCISLLVPLPPATRASDTAEATFGDPAAPPAEKESDVTGLPTIPHAKISVLIADDHAVVRDGLSRLLQTLPDMEVIGLAKDGREAVDLALELGPDVVIMDVSMPELNGIEATRRILADLPTTRIIGLSMHTDQDVAAQMRQAGAVDYCSKTGATNGLVAAIRACARKK